MRLMAKLAHLFRASCAKPLRPFALRAPRLAIRLSLRSEKEPLAGGVCAHTQIGSGLDKEHADGTVEAVPPVASHEREQAPILQPLPPHDLQRAAARRPVVSERGSLRAERRGQRGERGMAKRRARDPRRRRRRHDQGGRAHLWRPSPQVAHPPVVSLLARAVITHVPTSHRRRASPVTCRSLRRRALYHRGRRGRGGGGGRRRLGGRRRRGRDARRGRSGGRCR